MRCELEVLCRDRVVVALLCLLSASSLANDSAVSTQSSTSSVVELRTSNTLGFRFTPKGNVRTVLTSPDSNWLAIDTEGVTPRLARLWRVGSAADEDVQFLLGGTPWAFSADSRMLATTISGPVVRPSDDDSPLGHLLVYDTAGAATNRVKGTRALISLDHAPEHVVFVGGSFVSLDGDGTAHFWNLGTLKLEKKEPWGARLLALDAERTALIVATESHIVVRDPNTGAELRRRVIEDRVTTLDYRGGTIAFTVSSFGQWRAVVLHAGSLQSLAEIPRAEVVTVLSDGRLITRSTDTGETVIRGARGGKVLRSLGVGIGSIHQSADTRLILEASGGVLTLRDPGGWQVRAHWMPIPVPHTNRTFVVTRDGLFDGHHSTWAGAEFLLESGADAVPCDRFARDYYRPGLLREILAGSLPRPRMDIASIDVRVPTLSLRPHGEPPMFSDRRISLAIGVEGAPNGARDVRLLRNGMMIRRWRGEATVGKPIVVDVAVNADVNRFTAHAFSDANVKSDDAEHLHTGVFDPPQRTATVIAVGVNQYASLRNLRYAVSDAEEFAQQLEATLRRAGTRQRGRWQADWDDVTTVTLKDAEFTRDNLLAALARLGPGGERQPLPLDKLRKLKSTGPDDVVFVFFAGHGVLTGERFHMLASDAMVDRGAAPENSISDLDLDAALESIDARHIVLVIDSCHSGQVLATADDRLSLLNAQGLAELAYEKGMHILAASQSFQVAYETSALGHGLLTSALVEGLGELAGQADRDPEDGRLDLDEWLDWATGRVPAIHDSQRGGDRGVKVVVASDEAPKVQRPRVYSAPRLEGSAMTITRVRNPSGRK